MTVWAQVSEADVPRITVGMPVYFNTLGPARAALDRPGAPGAADARNGQ